MRRPVRLATILGLAAFLVGAAVAAGPPSSDASGQILDGQGNPVVGATVTFTNSTDPLITYTVKTDKKVVIQRESRCGNVCWSNQEGSCVHTRYVTLAAATTRCSSPSR